ncbi:hypothetical protein GN958_ATG06683, partial [Phytophthora infestans]
GILLGLNTDKPPKKCNGFPVLHPKTTTRQLGYWVGNATTAINSTTTENRDDLQQFGSAKNFTIQCGCTAVNFVYDKSPRAHGGIGLQELMQRYEQPELI